MLIGGDDDMNFDIEITRAERLAADPDPETTAAIWTAAATALATRSYRTDTGMVRVHAAWPRFTEEPTIRFPLRVADERQPADPRDLPAFVELFFHDAFLICNIAVPGSFSGTISTSGEHHRVRELTLSAAVFELASITAARNGAPRIRPLPLPNVIAWFDSLALDAHQLATTPIARALFHLLHLARTPDGDAMSLLRLTQAVEALGTPMPAAVLAIRDAIAYGTAPLFHPMHDDAIDPSIEEESSMDWIDAADVAASILVSELQTKVRRHS
jgi:hypothetical protein